MRAKAGDYVVHGIRRLVKIRDAIHEGFRLGVLDPESCQQLTDQHYTSTRNGTSFDENYFNQSFNLSGFFAWERPVLDKYFIGCTSVLIGAAGGGREMIEVARRGIRAIGFECNSDLFAACKTMLEAQGMKANVVQAKPNEVPDSLGVFDGAIIGWAAYTHMVGRARRVNFLKQIHKHIKPGGPLMLSFFIYQETISNRLKFQIARAIRFVRRSEAVEPGDRVSTRFDHQFTEKEIREELAAAKFDVLFYSEKGYGHAVATPIAFQEDQSP
jgi:hypothetical protein